MKFSLIDTSSANAGLLNDRDSDLDPAKYSSGSNQLFKIRYEIPSRNTIAFVADMLVQIHSRKWFGWRQLIEKRKGFSQGYRQNGQTCIRSFSASNSNRISSVWSLWLLWHKRQTQFTFTTIAELKFILHNWLLFLKSDLRNCSTCGLINPSSVWGKKGQHRWVNNHGQNPACVLIVLQLASFGQRLHCLNDKKQSFFHPAII